MFLSPVLAELISGSAPASVFFAPATFALFLFLGYGLPVLLIREFVVRRGLNQRAIFTLGLGYGIFNEGLLAKTMILQRNLPIHEFDNYGYLFGISVPWAVTISVWHAFSAVLFPILFTHRLYGTESRSPWLGKKSAIILAVLVVGIAAAGFLGKSTGSGTQPEAAVFLTVIAACIFVASRFRRRHDLPPVTLIKIWPPLFAGLSVLVAYAGVTHVAMVKPPLILFFLALSGVVLGYWALIWKCGWAGSDALILFGLGYYMQSAVLGTTARVMGRAAVAETLIVGVLTEIVLVSSAIKIGRSLKCAS